MPLISRIPEKIKEFNTTVVQLNKATGISRPTLAKIRDGHIPEYDMLLALCEFFECQLSDLFFYEVGDD